MIKNGEFTNKDGEVKNKWVQVGTILENNNGEYVLLDPTINLAGFDRQGRDNLIASIFEDTAKKSSMARIEDKNPEVDFSDDIPF